MAPPQTRLPRLCLASLSFLFCLAALASPASTAAATLEVLCAPAMRQPVQEALGAFQKATGIRAQISFDASNVLLGQLRLYPHGDVFIPADRFYTDEAVKSGLAEAPTVIAYLAPVILVRKGNPFGIHTLADLGKRGVRVGIGEERAAAIGRDTVEVLRRNRIPLAKLNVVYRAPKVDELGNALRLGSIDATVFWDAIAENYRPNVEILRIPDRQNVLVPVSAAVIRASGQKSAARRFVSFLTSAKGQAILRKHHYRTAPAGKG